MYLARARLANTSSTDGMVLAGSVTSRSTKRKSSTRRQCRASSPRLVGLEHHHSRHRERRGPGHPVTLVHRSSATLIFMMACSCIVTRYRRRSAPSWPLAQG
jgi:hypothetical protein